MDPASKIRMPNLTVRRALKGSMSNACRPAHSLPWGKSVLELICRAGVILWPSEKSAWVFSCSPGRVPIEAERKTEKESAWTTLRSSA
jgi:hypothetical protein